MRKQSFVQILSNYLYFYIFVPIFRFFAFPTEKRHPLDRDNWKKLIKWGDSKNHLWNPSKDSRVCSLHFVDSKPTPLNPNLTLVIGYNTDKRATLLPPSGKRKRKLNFALKVKGKKKKVLQIFQCSQKQLIQNQPNMMQRY